MRGTEEKFRESEEARAMLEMENVAIEEGIETGVKGGVITVVSGLEIGVIEREGRVGRTGCSL